MISVCKIDVHRAAFRIHGFVGAAATPERMTGRITDADIGFGFRDARRQAECPLLPDQPFA